MKTNTHLNTYHSYFILLLISSLFTNLNGQDITWNGGNGDWNVPSNWNLNSVPTSANDVLINSGTVTIPSGFLAEANAIEMRSVPGDGTQQLVISSGSSLTMDGSTGIFLQEGNITIEGDGRLCISNSIRGIDISGPSASFDNNGIINATAAIDGNAIRMTRGTFTNYSTGQVSIDNCRLSGISLNGRSGIFFYNDGRIDIGPEIGMPAADFADGMTINRGAVFENRAGAQFNIIGVSSSPSILGEGIDGTVLSILNDGVLCINDANVDVAIDVTVNGSGSTSLNGCTAAPLVGCTNFAPIPTLSEWGILTLLLIMLIFGIVVLKSSSLMRKLHL